MANIGRLITAMVTPFTSSGEVDYDQAQNLALALIDSGSDGVVVTGSTGEAPSLTHQEKSRLWREIKQAIGDKGSVIAGTGTYSTSESLELGELARESGADGLLIVVPYYNKPSQEGLFEHFKVIAESTSLPCIPYNVPSRTITNLNSETTVRLSKIPNIIGIKEASGDFDQIGRIIAGTDEEFRVWSGNDSDTFGCMSLGGYGVVSVASHLIGEQIKELISLIIAGENVAAAKEHLRQLPLAKGLFIESNPIPLKYCLNHIGFHVGGLRLPLTTANKESVPFLEELLSSYDIDLSISG